MFSFLGCSSTLLAARHDLTKARPPPPYPTPISFPSIDFLPEVSATWNQSSAPNLFQHYSGIRKLCDVSPHHLEVLNLSLKQINGSGIESIFSTIEIAKSFLPPRSWLTPPTRSPSHSPNSRLLNNGRPFPSQHEFFIRSKELIHTNEDAYRALARTPHNGQPPPRIAYFRRFWEALDNMAYYWDAISDNYVPLELDSQCNNKSDENGGIEREPDKVCGDADEPRKRPKPNPQQDNREASFDHNVSHMSPETPTIEESSPDVRRDPSRLTGTYHGNRIGNGAGMPESYRIDAARAFVEPIAWSFGFTLAAHRKSPVLEIKSLLVPIKLSGTVWRPPNQRDKARAGYLQGPVLGISCRSETEFAEGKADPTLDTLREVGAMLCLAQERAREGKTMRQPGEGKWWTTVPRWGGGVGGEMGEATVATDDSFVDSWENSPAGDDSRGRQVTRGNSSKKKQAIANAWKTLRVGVSFWDIRTEYVAVGKPPSCDWDEVFLVSSLNHHISIVKMMVHTNYLHYLRTSELPVEETDPAWSNPKVCRSRWYDMFNAEDRLEAFRLLWGIMGYLARVD